MLESALSLGEEPRPHQTLKMRGRPEGWRLRVGDSRITYSISDTAERVFVLEVLKRGKDTYR